MTNAIKCDKCGKYTDDAHSLLYTFVGAYSHQRENKTSQDLHYFDMCDECLEVVNPRNFLEMLRDKK